MMYNEFLIISDLTEDDVTVETYEKVLEPMYMALPNSMDKHDFVKLIDCKALVRDYPNKTRTIREIERVAGECKELFGHVSIGELKTKLYNLAQELAQFDGAESCDTTIYGDRGGYTMTSISINVIKWKDERHNEILWINTYRIDATKKALRLTREYKY